MGNDPNLVNAFLQQYLNCNKRDVDIPKKYRELIVMAIGMATQTATTTKVHAKMCIRDRWCDVCQYDNAGRPVCGWVGSFAMSYYNHRRI